MTSHELAGTLSDIVAAAIAAGEISDFDALLAVELLRDCFESDPADE